MKKIVILVAVIVAALTTAVVQSCRSNQSVSRVLKFNLEKGKGYDYEIIMNMDQQMMGQDTKMMLTGNYTMLVTEDDGTVKTLTGKYKSFKMNMKMMGIEIDIDTDKPSPPMTEDEMKMDPAKMMTRIFAGITGKSFTIKVDAEGNIVEVKGFPEIIQSIVDSSGMGEDIKRQMYASLKDQFNEQNIKDQFAQVFTIFPNKEVKVGDSWDKTYSTGGKMPAKNTITYTVKEIEGDHVTLTTKSKLESLNKSDMEINGEQAGTLLVDSKTGLVINSEFDLNMHTKVQGMEIETKAKGKIKGKAL